MTTNWRPEGWDEHSRFGKIINNVDLDDIYEAGANAMLEGIWDAARKSPTGIFLFDSNIKHVYAKILDIPKDTNDHP